MQGSEVCTPIGVLRIGFAPSFDFFDQCQALRTVLAGFMFDFVQPSLHHFVGIVASGIKTLPEGMIGQATLVGLLPFFTQLTQGFLHLATAHGRFKLETFLDCHSFRFFGSNFCLLNGLNLMGLFRSFIHSFGHRLNNSLRGSLSGNFSVNFSVNFSGSLIGLHRHLLKQGL